MTSEIDPGSTKSSPGSNDSVAEGRRPSAHQTAKPGARVRSFPAINKANYYSVGGGGGVAGLRGRGFGFGFTAIGSGFGFQKAGSPAAIGGGT